MSRLISYCATASTFNANISAWDSSSVTDMSYMFECWYESIFNQPLRDWDTSSVTNMDGLFSMASKFNQALGEWDVGKVDSMAEMFSYTIAFNQALGGWDVSKVVNMKFMFAFTSGFNQAIGGWNVGQVTSMEWTFYGALAFNQVLTFWDVRAVDTMLQMFYDARAFNQVLCWDVVRAGLDTRDMFGSADGYMGWLSLSSVTKAVGAKSCQCPAGRSSVGGTKFSAAGVETPCIACEPGKYSSRATSTACTSCAAGMVSLRGASSASSCFTCAPGTGWNPGSESCESCAVGSYGPHASGLGFCSACEAGTFSSASGTSACTYCDRGKASASTGATSDAVCGACAALLVTAVDFSACVDTGRCPVGSFEDSALASCVMCQAGRYMTEASYLKGSSACLVCEAGTSSEKGGQFCESCSAGTASTAGALCTSCQPGTYTAESGQTECQACTAGTASSVTASGSADDCVICSSGRASAAGATDCVTCGAGFYAGNDNTTMDDTTTLVIEGARHCFPCPVGYFSVNKGSFTCSTCSAGSANPTPGSTSCGECAAGKSSAAVAASCSNCSPGTFKVAAGLGVCDYCASGKRAANFGSTGCEDCPAGTAQGATGGSSCPDCLAGYVSGTAQSACVACSSGEYAASATACVVCPAGSAQGAAGSSACIECTAGSFSAASGSAACTDCPGNDFSSAGATACTLCLRGFYFTVTAMCDSCPTGTVCADDGGATQGALTLAGGYWRVSPTSVDVQACPLSAACVGGIGDVGAQRRELRDEESFSDGYCAKGYIGPLCGVCNPKGGYYFNPDEKACVKCSKGSVAAAFYSPTVLVFLGVAAIIVASTFLVYYFGGANLNKLKKQASDTAAKVEDFKAKGQALVQVAQVMMGIEPGGEVKMNRDGSITITKTETVEVPTKRLVVVNKMTTGVVDVVSTAVVETQASVISTIKVVLKPSHKIMVIFANLRKAQVKLKSLASFGQISINVGFNCAVTFPASFERVINSIKILNLDVMPSLGLQCKLSKFDYIDSMVASTLGPLLVVALLGLVYLFRRVTAAKPDAALIKRAASYENPMDGLSDAFELKELTDYRKVFAAMDEDGGGSIDKHELKKMIAKMDPELSENDLEEEVNCMLDVADVNGKDSISFGEFLLLMHRARRQGRTNKFAFLADKVEANVNEQAGSGVIYAILFFTFLVLISSSTALFNFFKCKTFVVPEEDGGDEQRYLVKDYSVDCNSARYEKFTVYALIMVLLFPVGIPSFYAALLFKKRETLRDSAAMDRELANGFPTVGHLAFLVDAYKPEYFYFEVLECFRRLGLASAIGIFNADSAVTPITGILICLGFIHVFTKWAPYKTESDNELGVTLAYSLVLLFLAALLVKVDVTTDDPQEQAIFGAVLTVILMSGPVAIVFQLLSSKSFRDLVRAFLCKKMATKKRLFRTAEGGLMVEGSAKDTAGDSSKSRDDLSTAGAVGEIKLNGSDMEDKNTRDTGESGKPQVNIMAPIDSEKQSTSSSSALADASPIGSGGLPQRIDKGGTTMLRTANKVDLMLEGGARDTAGDPSKPRDDLSTAGAAGEIEVGGSGTEEKNTRDTGESGKPQVNIKTPLDSERQSTSSSSALAAALPLGSCGLRERTQRGIEWGATIGEAVESGLPSAKEAVEALNLTVLPQSPREHSSLSQFAPTSPLLAKQDESRPSSRQGGRAPLARIRAGPRAPTSESGGGDASAAPAARSSPAFAQVARAETRPLSGGPSSHSRSVSRSVSRPKDRGSAARPNKRVASGGTEKEVDHLVGGSRGKVVDL